MSWFALQDSFAFCTSLMHHLTRKRSLGNVSGSYVHVWERKHLDLHIRSKLREHISQRLLMKHDFGRLYGFRISLF